MKAKKSNYKIEALGILWAVILNVMKDMRALYPSTTLRVTILLTYYYICMNNFHFAKIIAGVGPTLAKETVLSKIINMVDAFRITLSQGFDDNNKKYIDTIMKLDNSKTVMLEMKGADLRIKNVLNVKAKEWAVITVEYSEYAQENNKRIFIDAPFLRELPKGNKIKFEQSGVVLKVKEILPEAINCEVVKWGEVLQFDRVLFDKYDVDAAFLTDKDKKDLLRWLEYGVNMVIASMVKTKHDIMELKAFLTSQNADKMKVFAKIETEEALKNIDDIIETSDWIILCFDKIVEAMKAKKIEERALIKKCKNVGKPVMVTFIGTRNAWKYKLINESAVKRFCTLAVDGYMIDTMIREEDPLDIVTELFEMLEKNELKLEDNKLDRFYEDDNDQEVRDYIIYNAYRITREIDVRAMVTFTENGYTSGRLSSLAPMVPVISFTKVDETYRYLNLLRGVRGYKISQSFDYENLKRIGKEMIRIIFKGNISLDDKIIIVQANEMIKDERTDMINGVELYKFKNI